MLKPAERVDAAEISKRHSEELKITKNCVQLKGFPVFWAATMKQHSIVINCNIHALG